MAPGHVRPGSITIKAIKFLSWIPYSICVLTFHTMGLKRQHTSWGTVNFFSVSRDTAFGLFHLHKLTLHLILSLFESLFTDGLYRDTNLDDLPVSTS